MKGYGKGTIKRLLSAREEMETAILATLETLLSGLAILAIALESDGQLGYSASRLGCSDIRGPNRE